MLTCKDFPCDDHESLQTRTKVNSFYDRSNFEITSLLILSLLILGLLILSLLILSLMILSVLVKLIIFKLSDHLDTLRLLDNLISSILGHIFYCDLDPGQTKIKDTREISRSKIMKMLFLPNMY